MSRLATPLLDRTAFAKDVVMRSMGRSPVLQSLRGAGAAVGAVFVLISTSAGAEAQTSAGAEAQHATVRHETGRAVGTSCQSITGERLGLATTLSSGLQGQLPGLQILPTNGRAAAGSHIRLRGNATVGGSNEPLVYIDDIRISSIRISTVTRSLSAQSVLGALDFLDPSDVQRIEVLRGPAAATMYGMDAANGVILIYTKRGQGDGSPGEAKTGCGN